MRDFWEWAGDSFERLENVIDRLTDNTKAAHTVWRHRDGLTYTALLCDKLAYAKKYHRKAYDFWVQIGSAIVSSLVASVITCLILASLG